MSSTRLRLPAAQRREALVDTALRIFWEGSYRGVTTAEIARQAGVSEPILYRHFSSKRDLYLACLDEAWARLKAAWERIKEEEPPEDWLTGMGRSCMTLKHAKLLAANLWIQALVEASDDPEIRRYLRRQLVEVHDFVAGVISDAQAAGAVRPGRDPRAEAWVFLSLGLLGSIGRRLGGLVEDDLERIVAARREWMLGTPPA